MPRIKFYVIISIEDILLFLSNKPMQKQKAFTLIELLVAIAIIGLLATVVMVMVENAYGKARINKALSFSSTLERGLYPVGIWGFEDNVQDSSGMGNDGTIHGNPQYVNGMVGKALEFDGNDWVDCGNGNFFSSVFNNSNDFTLSAWVNPSSMPSNGTIIGQRYGDSMVFGHRNSGKLFLNMDDTRGSSPESSSSIKTNKWQYVAVSYTNSNHNARFYIDSELTGSGTAYDGNGIDVQNCLFIGYDSRYNYYFRGTIDEVRIYNEAISLSQIKKHYVEGLKKLLVKGEINEEEYEEKLVKR